jgi:predicted phage terminase large subunit-like protein
MCVLRGTAGGIGRPIITLMLAGLAVAMGNAAHISHISPPAQSGQRVQPIGMPVLPARVAQLRELKAWGDLARAELIQFARLTRPHPDDPANGRKSTYAVREHHKLIARTMEKVLSGEHKRLIIVTPPRHGKSELVVRRFVPWALGRQPSLNFFVVTYSDTFAADHGRDVRDVLRSAEFDRIFGRSSKAHLREDSQAMDRLMTQAKGAAFFVGRGGALTGRGADIIIVDDPIKDAEEANSATIRNKLWDWFYEVLLTRFLSDAGRLVIVQTRWHEDDLVGRLTDPKNPCYNAAEAARWVIVRLPALAEDDLEDPLGRQPGEALWEDRFSAEYLRGLRDMSPASVLSFNKLWQGRPSPQEGTFFKKEDLLTYQPEELPKELVHYCTSDHAVSEEEHNDYTVLLPFGVCPKGDIWVLPDVWWRRADTKVVVEAMLELMRRHRPLTWWAEQGHISKSIGPFLRDRMNESSVFCALDEINPAKDKMTRAQGIQGRCSLKRVHFPGFAGWWADAKDQMLTFPGGPHDDFVDALAYVGLGLDRLVSAEMAKRKSNEPERGTMAWVKWSSKQQEQRQRQQRVWK